MKKLSKRENQIMIALWNSSVPLSASALKKNLDEDVSIYTIQQVLQKLLKKEDGTWRLEVDIQDSRMLDGWVAMWKNDAQITLSQKEYLERETGDYDE